MKNRSLPTILVSLGLILLNISYAQEFSFILHFKDSLGNIDSLTLGYDSEASDSIDIEFGEENIILEPWNSPLDVRAGDTNPFDCTWNLTLPQYHSKKQWIIKDCDFYHSLNLIIHCENFPLKISWDTSLFKGDACRIASQLSGIWWFGWDITNPDQYTFLSPDFNLFESDHWKIDSVGAINSSCWYEEDEKKIFFLWITFANPSTLPPTDIYMPFVGEMNFKLLLNPSGKLKIKVPDIRFNKLYFYVYSTLGTLVYSSSKELILPNSTLSFNDIQLPDGIYLIKIFDEINVNTSLIWIKL